MKIPEQYLPVMPYLILSDAKAFFQFTQAAFGAKEQLLVPGPEGTVMHVEIRIGDAVIMFGQAGESWKQKTAAFYLYVPDVDRIYQCAIAEGATSFEQPLQKEYGYTASLEDPFGNYWFIVQPA